MCGIFGVYSSSERINQKKLETILTSLTHRGPDSSGIWLDRSQNIGLGHTRLSIMDTSVNGYQPMISKSGRFVITYNGEIYNFVKIRKNLIKKGHFFQSGSDTEVLLAAIEFWGINLALTKLSGMFSIGLWDKLENSLYIIRDRLGIKPLYYTINEGRFIFCSELKPIIKWIGKFPEISANGLEEFLRLGYVPAPLSIFENIFKLMPGKTIKYQSGNLFEPKSYWDLDQVIIKSKNQQYKHKDEAIQDLEKKLSTSVNNHMISDVSLGALLSGGIDSTTIVALMQKHSSKKVKTFTIGFDHSSYNEAKEASLIASYLGTDHNELYVSESEASKIIPELPNIYDEPFADTSQIPTSIVSSLARKHVTVALSGDGGDELFAGYNRYLFIEKFYKKLKLIPFPLRKIISHILVKYPPAKWDSIFNYLKYILPKNIIPALPGQKLNKIGNVLLSNSLLDIYLKLIAQWEMPNTLMSKDLSHEVNLDFKNLTMISGLEYTEQQMLWDTKSYLVDDILTKVDRASMNVGLEVRVPFLDHKVVETAWKIPLKMKINNKESKIILKEVLYKYVPKNMMNRPKMGFGIPIDNWLREGLFNWADDILSEQRIKKEGLFNSKLINQIWQKHNSCEINSGGKIWTLLMFEIWYEKAKKWI